MDIFGSFALLLAFLAAVYAFVGGLIGIYARKQLLSKSARHAGMAVFGLVTLAVASLEYFFFTDNFSLAYVAQHSNRALPGFYKFAALWAGQEGSLLWWSFLLSMFAFLALFLNRKRHPELMPWVGVILAGVQIFFLTLNNFVANPFNVIAGADSSGVLRMAELSHGSGLNPLLQYPEMVIHPPMLYLGYTGFTVPFAFALAALLSRYPGEKWIHITRRWTMVAWCLLGVGILLGAHWAYAVLGWGGYWEWDPVENAALLPWITGTAFLHSVMMQEKRGMMRVWNVWLVFSTFMLCILGTFLTRAGIVNSVHAFAESQIGGWFVGFLAIVLAVCLVAWYKNRDYLRSDNQLDSLVSRESSFLFNNLILLAACFAVLWGTLFPVFSEWFTGSKISVGPPFFDKVNIPIALFLLFLTGVGPLLAWRKTSFDALKRNFAWPLGIALVVGAVADVLGFRNFYALMCLILSVFVTLTIASEFFRGARVISSRDHVNIISALGELTMRNTRRYGGYIVHFGMVLIFIGIAGRAFSQDVSKQVSVGQSLNIGPYTLVCQNFDSPSNANYSSQRATIEVFRDGKSEMMLYPERRLFTASQVTETIVAIESSPLRDLYVVYSGIDPSTNKPVIHAFINPLVKFIWFGGIVVILGTGLAMFPERRTALVLRAATESSWGDTVPANTAPALSGSARRSGKSFMQRTESGDKKT
ncbi:MAG TPA: heme lyase CcmF/NrfE family subunit [Candidatus Dormibacteraeota bacterium]|nr:heme lyase CcmF/NrfE family subunit [Candidatus Dormibacteraeota bacterium]